MSETRIDPAWRALHLRKACGEALSDEERAAYEAGLREIQQTEGFPGDIEMLRQLRAEIARLKAEHAELQAREAELDRQMAALEARLSPEVRALLGSDDEVTRLSSEAVREVDQWERQE
jgi:hypothetical protein